MSSHAEPLHSVAVLARKAVVVARERSRRCREEPSRTRLRAVLPRGAEPGESQPRMTGVLRPLRRVHSLEASTGAQVALVVPVEPEVVAVVQGVPEAAAAAAALH